MTAVRSQAPAQRRAEPSFHADLTIEMTNQPNEAPLPKALRSAPLAPLQPQLRFDQQDDRIEIGPFASSSRFQRRGDFRAVQPDVDQIGRNGYPFDNVPDAGDGLD